MGLGDEYDSYVKNHPHYNEESLTKKNLRKIAYDFVRQKIDNFKKGKKRYWLVYYADNDGNREECNLFYSSLVYCYTKEEALLIISVDEDIDINKIDAVRMKLKTINLMNKYFLDN